jgi:hypothetical protein
MGSSGCARLKVLFLGVLTVLAIESTARGGTIAYVSGSSGIYAWDTGSNSVSFVTSAADGGALDSLIFDAGGSLIYSIIGTARIGKYDPSTGSNTILASAGNFNGVADMALEPGDTTFLLSNANGNTIDRVNVSTRDDNSIQWRPQARRHSVRQCRSFVCRARQE